jgi:hypothetical protein
MKELYRFRQFLTEGVIEENEFKVGDMVNINHERINSKTQYRIYNIEGKFAELEKIDPDTGERIGSTIKTFLSMLSKGETSNKSEFKVGDIVGVDHKHISPKTQYRIYNIGGRFAELEKIDPDTGERIGATIKTFLDMLFKN